MCVSEKLHRNICSICSISVCVALMLHTNPALVCVIMTVSWRTGGLNIIMFMRMQLYLCVGGETEKPQIINSVFSLDVTGIVLLVTILTL